MKRIVFLFIASLLVIGLVLPGCDGEENFIKIAVVGPLTEIQGANQWNGANLSASEINDAGGVTVGGTTYYIKLIEVDTHDFSDDPVEAMNYAIDNGAQFIIGGYRADEVAQMIPVAMSNHIPFFICGAASSELLAGEDPHPDGDGTPYYPYKESSADYKYIFRGTPFNDGYLLNNTMMMNVMVASRIATIIGANATNKVKFAILSESLDWAHVLTEKNRYLIGTVAPGLFGLPWQLAPGGNNGTGVWRVSDNPTTTVMTNILNNIAAGGAHIIVTILSGPVGVTFGKLKGSLGVPAMVVGINVEGQSPDYWANTQYGPGQYGAEYEIYMSTWAPNIRQTGLTDDFLTGFEDEYHTFPIYTAASYDILYGLVDAIEDVGSVTNTDAIIAWLENLANAQLTTTGISAHYPLWDGSTTGEGRGFEWPALNVTQINGLYASTGYNPACNFTMPPYTTHDLVYGPGWETGIAVQWQNDGGVGKQVGVWPNNDTWTDQNTMSRYVAGINWTDVEYTGTEDFEIPQWMIDEWTK